MSIAVLIALLCGLFAVAYGVWAGRAIVAAPAGNERMQEIARAPDAPILGAATGKQRLTPIEVSYWLAAGAKEGRVEDAFATLLTEVRRMRSFGVTESELNRARKRLQASYQTYYNEREKTASSTHAGELVRVFTTGEAAPGVTAESKIAQRFLQEIDVQEVNAFAAGWLPDAGRVVSVTMPEKEGLIPPTEEALAAVAQRVDALALVAPSENASDRPLLAKKPTPGRITERISHDALGVLEWRLSNGMRVFLKATDFKDDQVRVLAQSVGGTETASDATFPSARAALGIAARSGLGEFDALELRRLLAGRRVSASPTVSGNGEGVAGSSSKEDLETLFTLLHLQFTASRLDETGLRLFLEQSRESIRNRLKSPSTWFEDRYRELMWQGFARFEPWTEE
ncbi:MAG: hypothetical protein AAF658_18860, partial [Myxococcota bacterium]